MVRFQAAPPFSYDEFLERCQPLIAEREMSMLRNVAWPHLCGEYGSHPVLEKWHSFERGLRNELVKIRAHRKHIDAGQYMRGETTTDTGIMSLVRQATKTVSVLEAEEMLDEARWHYVDALELGHYFDQEALLAYALKLLITIRWQHIKEADVSKGIEDTITSQQSSTENTAENNS